MIQYMLEGVELSLAIVVALGLVAFNTTAVALVVLQLPGTWLMLIGTVAFAIWRGGAVTPGIGGGTLLLLLVLAALGEVVEAYSAARGARKGGSTKTGAILAIVGGIGGAAIGSLMLLGIGTIIGACLGAAAGSLTGDVLRGRRWGAAGSAARGAAVGKLWGTLAKILIAVLMWLIVVVALIVP